MSTKPSRSVVYYDVGLDDDFAVRVGRPELQHDKPISALHWHDSLEVGICIEGAGIFVVGEKVLPFSAGDVTMIGPTEVHLAQSLPGTISTWFWIYLDPVRLLPLTATDMSLLDVTALSGPDFDNVLRPFEDPSLGVVVQMLVDEVNNPQLGQRASVASLVTQLLVRIRRLRGSSDIAGPEDRRVGFDRIAPAIAIIARDFADELVLADLARACRVSEPTLRRLFQSAVGQTPREYWLGLRLRMAATMLRGTTLPVIEVSRQVGFTTLSSFNRLFLRQFGATPTAWRNNRVPEPRVGVDR